MKVLGICMIIAAILSVVAVYCYVRKKAFYDDFWDMVIDSLDFLQLIGAVVLLGILFACS